MALQVIEVCFVICFMFFNILVSAYIIGTITLMVVRGDQRTREYRDRMKAVSEYTDQHGIPKMLRDAGQLDRQIIQCLATVPLSELIERQRFT